MSNIFVTQPYLPDKKKYMNYISEIYRRNILTNNGVLVQELTKRLEEYLDVKNLILVSSGTIALQIAFRILKSNNIISTPFSFIATASSAVWECDKIKFADIDKNNFNIDCKSLVENLDPTIDTVLPVHVFGNPCDVEAIDKISEQYNLKVVYDAAHAFGVKNKNKNKNIVRYGDISILSFHATKIFHTIEGGALIIKDDELYEKTKSVINFGFYQGKIKYLGINAKMNEFQAAMGLCMLDEIDSILEKRHNQYNIYRNELNNVVIFQKLLSETTCNFSYTPVIFSSEEELLRVEEKLKAKNIFARRYFYPSLNKVSILKNTQNLPNSEDISKRILCLPMYHELTETQQYIITKTIKKALESND